MTYQLCPYDLLSNQIRNQEDDIQEEAHEYCQANHVSHFSRKRLTFDRKSGQRSYSDSNRDSDQQEFDEGVSDISDESKECNAYCCGNQESD